MFLVGKNSNSKQKTIFLQTFLNFKVSGIIYGVFFIFFKRQKGRTESGS